jgi:RHS repeat-associated protein
VEGTNEYYQATTGHVFVSKASVSFTHDLDGNLTSDGRWTNRWDGENRLIRMETLLTVTNSGVPRQSLDFGYDWMWRRTQKFVSNYVGGSWVKTSELRFAYAKWNPVAEFDGQGTLLKSHIWGLDASGTMQGAGGVGGLLATVFHTGANAGTYFPVYDGSHMVRQYIRASDGIVVAEYEYDPFHGLIRASGPMAREFNFLAATKYYDWETGLYYYGYRYYGPDIVRWLSRDPIGEFDFQNYTPQHEMLVEASRSFKSAMSLDGDDKLHYVFVRNAPINHIDYLGLQTGCWYCGRAIDQALLLTLVDVVKRYDNLSLWGKIKACTPIWVPVPGFEMAWDMNKITWDWGADMHCGKEKTCNRTVTVAGGCYNAWDVNFLSYGWAARLCGMPLGDFLAHIAGWKFIAKPIFADDCEGNDWEKTGQWGAFAIAGYYFNFNPPASPSSLSACKACDKRVPYSIHLDSKWP